jgi:hypothetical protein
MSSPPREAADEPPPEDASPGTLRRLVDVELTMLGILSQLASQWSSGRWSHVTSGLRSADPCVPALARLACAC